MGRTALMSMKAVFAEAAYNRTKKYEYRRCSTRIASGDLIVIYESAPTMKVTGTFTVGEVIVGSPSIMLGLEKLTSISASVEQYLAGARVASALEIRDPRRFAEPLKLRDACDVARPPQSYCFVAAGVDELLRNTP